MEKYIGDIILFNFEIELYRNIHYNTERLYYKGNRIDIVEIYFLKVTADIDPTFAFEEISVFIKFIEEHPFQKQWLRTFLRPDSNRLFVNEGPGFLFEQITELYTVYLFE